MFQVLNQKTVSVTKNRSISNFDHFGGSYCESVQNRYKYLYSILVITESYFFEILPEKNLPCYHFFVIVFELLDGPEQPQRSKTQKVFFLAISEFEKADDIFLNDTKCPTKSRHRMSIFEHFVFW